MTTSRVRGNSAEVLIETRQNDYAAAEEAKRDFCYTVIESAVMMQSISTRSSLRPHDSLGMCVCVILRLGETNIVHASHHTGYAGPAAYSATIGKRHRIDYNLQATSAEDGGYADLATI